MNFKGELQEYLQPKGLALPEFKSEPGRDGIWHSTAIFDGRRFEAEDSQKHRSQNLVAADILKYLKGKELQSKAPGPRHEQKYFAPFASAKPTPLELSDDESQTPPILLNPTILKAPVQTPASAPAPAPTPDSAPAPAPAPATGFFPPGFSYMYPTFPDPKKKERRIVFCSTLPMTTDPSFEYHVLGRGMGQGHIGFFPRIPFASDELTFGAMIMNLLKHGGPTRIYIPSDDGFSEILIPDKQAS